MLIASPSTWASSWVKSTTYTEFQISTAGNDFVFKATSPANAKKWVKLLSQRIEHTKTLSPASAARGDQNADEENHDEDDYHDLLMVPESGGAKAFFYFVYPMLFVFKYTIPDVRKSGALLRDVASFFLCITGNTRGAFCTRSAILFPGTYRSLCNLIPWNLSLALCASLCRQRQDVPCDDVYVRGANGAHGQRHDDRRRCGKTRQDSLPLKEAISTFN